MLDLDGASVVVTGSSSGIGEAVARAFAAAGARVVVNSSTSREAGERLAAELPGAVYVQGDVSREADARRLIDTAVERFGRLDHVVNNAGTTVRIPHHDLDAATDEVWRRILDVNVMGTWYVSRCAVAAMRRGDGGSITNITSLAGVRAAGSSVPYAVSKAALNHLTLLLANALGPDIRVNAVAPGLVATPWTETWTDLHEAVAAQAPLQRSGEPVDVADMCLALARAPYVTGQVVLVDGGLSLR